MTSPRAGRRLAVAFLKTAAFVGLSVTVASPAGADRVVLKKGAPLRGAVTRTDTEVVVNRFRSTTLAMTYGVVRVPADQVKRVDEESVPDEVVRRRHDGLAPDDVAGRVGLAKYATSVKSRLEAQRLLEEALVLEPTHNEALALYGGPEKWQAMRRGNPALDPDLKKALAAWLQIEDKATRAREARALEAKFGYPAVASVLERAWKSAREPKGLREDLPLTLRSDKHPGARFTVYVPEGYDPLTPTPLVLALHGGGAGGRDHAAVVGNGRDASTLYLQAVTSLGWILVCPTALRAPWDDPANEPWLTTVLEEVEARFDVDLDRVYLTGHSMGGFGTWWFGPRHAELFAAIGPTAGGGGAAAVKKLAEKGTPVFVYHSADDPVVGVASDQQAATALLDAGADVVYLQLEDRGHSFPAEAEKELFDVFRVKRLIDPKRASAWPRSSFSRKPSPDEAKYLGDPEAVWAPDRPSPETLKALVSQLERGGGGAEQAAAEIAQKKPEGAATVVAKVLRGKASTDDARAWAARCLGDLADAAAVPALAETVAEERPARVVREAATALRKLADASAADALGRALTLWSGALAKRMQGDKVDFPDWEEVCLALADVVEAYAVCAPAGTATAGVDRWVVKAVLSRGVDVQALARAGQDASRPRARLAEAAGRAYATLAAPAVLAQQLEAAVAADPAAVEAAKHGAASPFPRARGAR